MAEFTSWASADRVTSTDSVFIGRSADGGPCPMTLADRPFDFGVLAGLVNPVAGSSSPFVLRLTRPDGHQELRAMNGSTPEGLSAVLKGVPRCTDAQAAGRACPARGQRPSTSRGRRERWRGPARPRRQGPLRHARAPSSPRRGHRSAPVHPNEAPQRREHADSFGALKEHQEHHLVVFLPDERRVSSTGVPGRRLKGEPPVLVHLR